MRFNHSEASTFLRRIVVITVVASMLFIPTAAAETDNTRAADGISTQTLASTPAIEDGGQVVTMRIVIDPDVALGALSHPGSSTFIVISGALQTTLVRGGASINRGGIDQEARLGAIVNLSAGQVISYSRGAVKTMTNHGPERLVLMGTMLLDPGEPMIDFEDGSPLSPFDLQ